MPLEGILFAGPAGPKGKRDKQSDTVYRGKCKKSSKTLHFPPCPLAKIWQKNQAVKTAKKG